MTTSHRLIEIRSFKLPQRAISAAQAHLLGEDVYGQWPGITQGSLWSSADGSRSGIFTHSFVKLVPMDTLWTACFQDRDPIVDVDIVAPVKWIDDTLEEVDLELDILQYADGSVSVRDQNVFHYICEHWNIAKAIAAQAEQACQQICTLLKERQEPFSSIGHRWLSLHLCSADT
jgi:hypothetical protein